MADFDSSLPVRTQNDGDVAVKVVDATNTAQQLAIDADGKVGAKLSDGAGNEVTSQANGGQQALDVGINVGGVQIDPRDVRALTATDVVTADQGAPNTAANGWPVKPTDGTNSQVFTAAGEAQVEITQELPAGTQLIGSVDSRLQDGAGVPVELGQEPMATSLPVVIASDQSPVPVYITEDPAIERNAYNTAASLAAAATSNHDFTPTNAFRLRQVGGSASGKLKMEIQIETAAASDTFNTVAVLFNSTATPNAEKIFSAPIPVPAGARVRVIRTNRDESSQDVYSTISGAEAP